MASTASSEQHALVNGQYIKCAAQHENIILGTRDSPPCQEQLLWLDWCLCGKEVVGYAARGVEKESILFGVVNITPPSIGRDR